jgi:hypothetical protein
LSSAREKQKNWFPQTGRDMALPAASPLDTCAGYLVYLFSNDERNVQTEDLFVLSSYDPPMKKKRRTLTFHCPKSMMNKPKSKAASDE